MISAAGSRGKANGEDVTYSNSHLAAGNTATVISGNDTTLKGAQLSADKVIADVGGNLSIESLQDTSTYDSKDKSVGASVTFGAGFSASASYSSNKVSGDFASVTEQSGIQAGDGGFNIRVGGNTDLKGAVIASTQAAVDAGVNRLQTGTLTYSDIENTSSYDAKGFSLSGGYSKEQATRSSKEKLVRSSRQSTTVQTGRGRTSRLEAPVQRLASGARVAMRHRPPPAGSVVAACSSPTRLGNSPSLVRPLQMHWRVLSAM